jgi:hypothetical protein
VAVKNALDDAVREVMTVRLPYIENHSLMDGRLLICGIAVATAMFALLWDYLYPFPKVQVPLRKLSPEQRKFAVVNYVKKLLIWTYLFLIRIQSNFFSLKKSK